METTLRSNCSRYRWQILLCIISFLALFELLILLKWANYPPYLIIDGCGDPVFHDPAFDPDKLKEPCTNFNGSASLQKEKFWESLKPSYKCPPSLLYRVGGKDDGGYRDGGKWVCGLHTLGRRTLEKGYNCTVYSFGVNGESSFEAEVLETTQCTIFAFDPTVYGIGKPIKRTNPRIKFQKVGLGGSNDGTLKTLKTLMDERGHKFIDILKIDIEGAEYNSLERMMKDFKELPFGQLLVELHNFNWKPPKYGNRDRVLDLIRKLERKGARVFSNEPNANYPSCCSEFAFINLKYLRLFFP